ncbi:hypothetical protein MIR68_000362 [Amoeboaphelidium protococcarum]|nr:hypothetical protein MIR68_000362 [Amoeboaphelidium protococcarum]
MSKITGRIQNIVNEVSVKRLSNSAKSTPDLREAIWGIPRQLTSEWAQQSQHRTAHQYIAHKMIRSPMWLSHWSVPEIWDWPRDDNNLKNLDAAAQQISSGQVMEWTNVKKLSIEQRLLALAKRGKGPIVKKQQAASGAATGKKKRR